MADYHLVVTMRSFNSVTFREYILLGDAKELEGKGIGVKMPASCQSYACSVYNNLF